MTDTPNGLKAIVPNPRWGMTASKHQLPATPIEPANRAELDAANAYNDIRFGELTSKQRTFLDVYTSSGMDGAKAARHSGLVAHDASDRAAKGAATRLINKPYMQKALRAYDLWLQHKLAITAEKIIREYAHLAFSNMADYMQAVGADGEIVPCLPDPVSEREKYLAVQEVTVDEYTEGRGEDKRTVKRTKFKLYSKADALGKLATMLGVDSKAKEDEQANGGLPQITKVQIVPVPAGSFLPAPQNPHLQETFIEGTTTRFDDETT